MKHFFDERIVACVPVEEGKVLMPSFPACATYSTYEQVPCPQCNRTMWLGARGKVEVEAKRATMLCMPCILLAGMAHASVNVDTLHKSGKSNH